MTQPQQPNQRLIAAKQDVAQRGIARGVGTGVDAPARDRLPPGQHLVESEHDFPVLDLGIQPEVAPGDWRLEFLGACDSPAELSLAQLERIGLVDLTTDFHCVTKWSTFDNPWRGAPMGKLLALAQPDARATHVMFHSYDGYTTNVPLADCMRAESMFVTHWRGKPLERKHGGPVRGMIPHLYAWKSAKWVKGVEFLTQDQPGFWEVRGYHNNGDPWKEERFG